MEHTLSKLIADQSGIWSVQDVRGLISYRIPHSRRLLPKLLVYALKMGVTEAYRLARPTFYPCHLETFNQLHRRAWYEVILLLVDFLRHLHQIIHTAFVILLKEFCLSQCWSNHFFIAASSQYEFLMCHLSDQISDTFTLKFRKGWIAHSLTTVTFLLFIAVNILLIAADRVLLGWVWISMLEDLLVMRL